MASEENPVGEESGTWRVLRGASWIDYDIDLRCATRYNPGTPYASNSTYGFRAARTVTP